MAEQAKQTTAPEQETPAPAPAAKQSSSFTQEDVDRIVRERIQRERDKYADYDQIKERAGRLDAIEESQRTDLEKAQKRAEKAERERDEAVQRANTSLAKAAVVAEASKRGVIDPDAAYRLLPEGAVTVGDDGQVAGLDEALSALVESKPYLVGNTAPSGGDGGPMAALTPSSPAGASPEQAHNEFITQLFGGSS